MSVHSPAPTIDRFSGSYRFLSNFYPSPVYLDTLVYSSVEHAYQAAKTQDLDERLAILDAATPGIAKSLGRRVTLRSDWEQIKEKVMLDLLRQKFKAWHLEQQLLATKDAHLVEGNTWGDTYWGVCGGLGKNRLGVLLEIVRGEIVSRIQREKEK